jgi:hypothetical protein
MTEILFESGVKHQLTSLEHLIWKGNINIKKVSLFFIIQFLQSLTLRPPLKICSFPAPDPPFHLWVGR